jgi:hypothetical protein
MDGELGIDAQLIEGDKGVFDVVADGDLVFSKYAAGRFPEHGEIIQALRSRASPECDQRAAQRVSGAVGEGRFAPGCTGARSWESHVWFRASQVGPGGP